VNTSLPALNIAYGKAASWALEVTGAYNRAAYCGAGALPSTVFSRSRPTAANYLEVGDIDTITTPNTTGVDPVTANTFTDGITLNDGTFVPLNQVRTRDPSSFTPSRAG